MRDVQVPTLSVRELAEVVSALLERHLPEDLWVEGEIASLSRSRSGHVWFSLVEPDGPGSPPAASVSVVLFDRVRRQVNERLRAGGALRMDDGIRIRIRGRLEFYGPQGRLQLRMTDIDPAFTLGRLALEREQLLARLRAEQLLEANRAVPMPALPETVGVVTALGSAAHADVLHELESAGVGVRVLVADAAVQGRDAPASIVAALARLQEAGAEVLAIVRGGGARTDLAAFDDERVARAIAGSPVPVLTGIGHETDRSVADEVAHRAYKTPTACGAALVAPLLGARAELDQVVGTLPAAIRSALATERDRLRVGWQAVDRVARAGVLREQSQLTTLDGELRRCTSRSLASATSELDVAEARLTQADPARHLARGWSITTTATGRIVRSPDDAAIGEVIVTTTTEAVIRSVVDDVSARSGAVMVGGDGVPPDPTEPVGAR